MKVRCRDLGEMDYAACWELQRSLFDRLAAAKRSPQRGEPRAASLKSATEKAKAAAADEVIGTILLVEHPPVYTLGKSGRAENLLVDRTTLEGLGAQFFHIDRGGDITFHGPGQLVCYPILDLERIGIGLREYIERLEEAVIRTVARYGIKAGRIAGASGVWIDGPTRIGDAKRPERDAETVGSAESRAEETAAVEHAARPTEKGECAPRKICAVGVRASRFVTMHGFALNVDTDLGWFSRINPCGFSDRGATSIARETGREAAMEEVKRLLIKELERQLDIEIEK